MNTAKSKQTDDCCRFACSMAPYVDGELDPCHAVDMEAHVVDCSPCADRVALLRAMRVSLKRTCALRASDAFRSRMGAVLADEQRRAVAESDAPRAPNPKLIRLRYAVGLAAAAGVAFAMNIERRVPVGDPRPVTPTSDVVTASSLDTLLDDLVALHAHPLPPETTSSDDLQQFDPLVGVPVRRPQFQPFGASFKGARLNARADRRAALLTYTVIGGHRLTVYIFDPHAYSIQAMNLQERRVRERPVYVGTVRGYAVAASERSGVGYALASDLDTDQSARMVDAAAAH